MEMTENRVGSAAYRSEPVSFRKSTGGNAETAFSVLLQDARGRLRTDGAEPALKREPEPENRRTDGSGSAEKLTGNTEIHTEKERTEKDEKAEAAEGQTVQNEAAALGIVPLLLFAPETAPEDARAAAEPCAGIPGSLTQEAAPGALRETDARKDSVLTEIASEEAPVTERRDAEMLLRQVPSAESIEEAGSAPPGELQPERMEDAGNRSRLHRDDGGRTEAAMPEREPLSERVSRGEASRSGRAERTEQSAGESGSAAALPQGMAVRQENGAAEAPIESMPRETLPTTRTALPESLSGRIASQLRNGLRGELLIQLEPRNLGQILLRVSYTGMQARVSLYADDAGTMELLSRNAQEMAQIITEKTGTVTAVLIPERQAETEMQNSGNNTDNRDRAAEEMERRLREKTQESGDFLQQLRLGLV